MTMKQLAPALLEPYRRLRRCLVEMFRPRDSASMSASIVSGNRTVRLSVFDHEPSLASQRAQRCSRPTVNSL